MTASQRDLGPERAMHIAVLRLYRVGALSEQEASDILASPHLTNFQSLKHLAPLFKAALRLAGEEPGLRGHAADETDSEAEH